MVVGRVKGEMEVERVSQLAVNLDQYSLTTTQLTPATMTTSR